MVTINDGTGTQRNVKVDSENRMQVFSTSIPKDHHIADTSGKVWSVPFKNIDPTGADDYFLIIRNESTVANLNITDFRISSTVAGIVEIQAATGTAVGGTDIVAVSRKIGATVEPDAILQSGSDITGLTNEGILFFMNIETNNSLSHLRTSSNIIISPGGCIALLWQESTGVLTGMISITEELVNGG